MYKYNGHVSVYNTNETFILCIVQNLLFHLESNRQSNIIRPIIKYLAYISFLCDGPRHWKSTWEKTGGEKQIIADKISYFRT